MLRQLIITSLLATVAAHASAGVAGKVIFAAGAAKVVERAAAEGTPVEEGELLSTGADGFIYVKTIDNGLFILRPNTKARIVSYYIDAKNPANTRIKLELLSGVARSRSGEAVKQARQNFRFNTPVAAIGVRGTDFTVFTDENTSRVAVISGGIVISGFANGCSPEGSGPCEGAASRELFATQRGQLLQVQRGQAAPQMLQGGALAPDQMAPPRSDEPIGKNSVLNSSSNVAAGDPNLDPSKQDKLNQLVPTNKPVEPPPVETKPPVVVQPEPEPTPAPTPVPVPEPEKPVVQLPPREVVWGRWQAVANVPATINLVDEKAKNELLAVNGNYALLRTSGRDYVAPERGSVAFALQGGEAMVSTTIMNNTTVTPATLTNGSLDVNFDQKTFATSLDIKSNFEVINMHATGALGANGRLHGDLGLTRPGYMNVQGLLTNDAKGTAAYVFDGRIDADRTVNGAAFFQQK